MSLGDRYTPSSYRKIFGDSLRLSSSSSRVSGAAPRGPPALRSMAATRSSASPVGLYRRLGRPADSLDLSQTSVANSELKVIRTNEKEQLQVGLNRTTQGDDGYYGLFISQFKVAASNVLSGRRYDVKTE